MAYAALDFDGVTVRYSPDRPPALNELSLLVEAGERVALLGANGSGKTTLLMAPVGLVPFAGRIHVAGLRLDPARPEPVRQRIGMLFSTPDDQLLFPRVLDDVAFTLRRRGEDASAAEALARAALIGLEAEHLADSSPYRLSRGERLRAALAGTLVADPPLLLLDEPSSGLDPAGRRLLAAQLNGLPSAMLIATHDIEFAQRCCQRFILLHAGRILRKGTDFATVAL